MKVISLWQPFASLIFAGIKNHETRSFRFPDKLTGERIAIHATAKFTPDHQISREVETLCTMIFGPGYRNELPRSAIIGTVRLVANHPTDERVEDITQDDFHCGNWSPERFAWELAECQKLVMPIPAKGQQGWWKTLEEHEPLLFHVVESTA